MISGIDIFSDFSSLVLFSWIFHIVRIFQGLFSCFVGVWVLRLHLCSVCVQVSQYNSLLSCLIMRETKYFQSRPEGGSAD